MDIGKDIYIRKYIMRCVRICEEIYRRHVTICIRIFIRRFHIVG